MGFSCPRDGMVDITDLKSVEGNLLPVQVRPRVPYELQASLYKLLCLLFSRAKLLLGVRMFW